MSTDQGVGPSGWEAKGSKFATEGWPSPEGALAGWEKASQSEFAQGFQASLGFSKALFGFGVNLITQGAKGQVRGNFG